MTAPLHLSVALDGAGFHPAAWRDPSARPKELFTARYWSDIARSAERGLLDFITIEDAFSLQSSRSTPDDRTDQVRGRLDAVLIASVIAPSTKHLGLIPTVIPTHTEPFHVASAISTLDWVSKGRAGWRPQISWKSHEATHVGVREVPPIDRRANDDVTRGYITDLFDEAADAVEVVRRLWDSWEDDAIIRDVSTGRFVDRDRLHYIDFRGRFFNVKGPSIVPRPPQGQPIVAALAHSEMPFRFAAKSADVVFVTPSDGDDVSGKVGDIRAAEHAVEHPLERLLVFADLVVFLDESIDRAEARRARLDELDGHAYRSDAAFFVGTPDGLADQLVDWQRHGLDGFRLRPAVVAHDLDAIVDRVVPALQKRGAFRTEYPPGTLRARLGLPRPQNRYVTS